MYFFKNLLMANLLNVLTYLPCMLRFIKVDVGLMSFNSEFATSTFDTGLTGSQAAWSTPGGQRQRPFYSSSQL